MNLSKANRLLNKNVSRCISTRFFSVEKRLAEEGIVLPVRPPDARGNYLPYVRSGNMVYLAGKSVSNY